MAFTKEQQREYRKKLYEAGICSRCHKEKRDEGSSTCPMCKKYFKERSER